MASEDLRYDFELNLARAEKNIDRFLTSFETRLDRVSSRMEKIFESASKGLAGSGGRSGRGTSGIERDARQTARRQATDQRDAARQQQRDARALNTILGANDREQDRRRKQIERQRVQDAKSAARQAQKDATTSARIVDNYDRTRRTRKDSLDNISSRAELRSRAGLDRIDFGLEDDKALSKALTARKRFADAVNRIMSESSWKSLATVRTEIAQEEAIYKGALNRIAPKNAARKSAGGGFFSNGKGVGAAFQVQQAIEDYSYAGFRGLSNNLAFLGASLGGKAGLAVIAGVAAKGLYDLTAATMGWGKAAEEAAERGKRAAQAMKDVDDIRRQIAEIKSNFRAPDDMAEFRRREEQLRKDEERLRTRQPAIGPERDLPVLRKMLEIRQNLKDAEATERRTEGFGFVGGVAHDRAEGLRKAMQEYQSKLTAPVPLDSLETIIKDRQEALQEALKEDGLLKNRIDTESKLLAQSRQLVQSKAMLAEIEDKVSDKLREQQHAEEHLAELAKDRAKSVRDSMESTSDSFASNEVLQFARTVQCLISGRLIASRTPLGTRTPATNDGVPRCSTARNPTAPAAPRTRSRNPPAPAPSSTSRSTTP